MCAGFDITEWNQTQAETVLKAEGNVQCQIVTSGRRVTLVQRLNQHHTAPTLAGSTPSLPYHNERNESIRKSPDQWSWRIWQSTLSTTALAWECSCCHISKPSPKLSGSFSSTQKIVWGCVCERDLNEQVPPFRSPSHVSEASHLEGSRVQHCFIFPRALLAHRVLPSCPSSGLFFSSIPRKRFEVSVIHIYV